MENAVKVSVGLAAIICLWIVVSEVLRCRRATRQFDKCFDEAVKECRKR